MKVKILRIKTSGFKKLEDNFEIDLLSKARVNEYDLESEILELDNKLYYPAIIGFTGKNASGKSTVLDLIYRCYYLLRTGRFEYYEERFGKEKIDLEIWFIQEGYVYHYKTEINKPLEKIKVEQASIFCIFKNEVLYKRKYASMHSKNILNQEFERVIINSEIDDTSILYNITKYKYRSIFLYNFPKTSILDVYIKIMDDIGQNLKANLIKLFDDSIEVLEKSEDDGYFILKRIGEIEKKVNFNYLATTLSDGTIKGLLLFFMAINALSTGEVLIVDEIENSFHKNLIENLILLFKDKRINKHNACLILSTHYVEVLDIFNRSDNIFVCEKTNGYVKCKNLHFDYDEDTRLKKSNLYNKNAFNTLLDYDVLMNLKRDIIDEISNND